MIETRIAWMGPQEASPKGCKYMVIGPYMDDRYVLLKLHMACACLGSTYTKLYMALVSFLFWDFF